MVKGGRMVWGHMEGGVVNVKSRTGWLLDAAWRLSNNKGGVWWGYSNTAAAKSWANL